MEVESLTLFRLQPALYFGVLVGAVVIHDQAHLPIGREDLFQMVQEADEYAAAMPILERRAWRPLRIHSSLSWELWPRRIED